MWTSIRVAFFLAFAASASACAQLNDINVEGYSGATKGIEISECDRVLVRLAGNPTTGYSWRGFVDDGAKGTLGVSEAQFVRGSSNLIGAGGTFVFRVTPESGSSGTSSAVRFYYVRPWEQPDPRGTEAHYVLNVQVK